MMDGQVRKIKKFGESRGRRGVKKNKMGWILLLKNLRVVYIVKFSR